MSWLVFPSSRSVTRRLASLHRIARGSLLRLRGYHQGAPTSRRPSRPTSRVRRAIPRTTAITRGKRGVAGGRLLVGTHAGASILFRRSRSWRSTGSPRFLGSPFASMLCSPTPADPARQAFRDAHDVAFPSVDSVGSAILTFRGSITRPARSLSTLRGSDYSDHTTQDSLPAGGQPWRGRT